MRLEIRELKQTAVYWAPSGPDEYGRPSLAAAVEIDCRWEDTAEEFVDPQGTRQISSAKVFVGQDLEVGGLLMLGEIEVAEDSSFPANPKNSADVHEVRLFSKNPSLRATRFLRFALL